MQTFLHGLSCVLSALCLAVVLTIGWFGYQAYREVQAVRAEAQAVSDEINEVVDEAREMLKRVPHFPFREEP